MINERKDLLNAPSVHSNKISENLKQKLVRMLLAINPAGAGHSALT
jgi:hypothetical protein